MTGESVKRAIKRMAVPGVEAKPVEGATPEFRWVDPADLLVDEAYQRGLSEKSVTLIRKVVGGWDWARFKPPVVAETADGLEVIDGQHTAIAAATHPGIEKIPVMVVFADQRESRAAAFVGHNRDRIQLTPMQMHAAAVAAGDEDSVTIEAVCARAGVKVLRNSPANGVFKPGDTVAIKAIGALINRRGAMRARMVLEIVAKANAAPVGTAQIKAVEMLLHDREYAGQVEADAVTTAIIALGDEAAREAKVFSVAHKVPLWRALGVILFRRATRGRRRAA